MDKDIGTLLREIKEKTQWSEAFIGQKIGASQATVNRILNGQPDCKGKTQRAIENLYIKASNPS